MMSNIFENTQGELERSYNNEKMMYVYIPERVAKILNNIDTIDINKEAFIELIGEMKSQVEIAEDDIEQAILNLKVKSRAIKDSYKKQVTEEINMLTEFWEELDKERAKIQRKVKDIYSETKGLKDEVNELKKSLSDINIYGLSSLVELVEKINNMNESDKELLSNMFNGYKK